jgi:signal transduction histidine kinase
MGLEELAQGLRGAKAEIVHRWEAAVRDERSRVPSAQGLSGPALSDHLPLLLECVAAAIEGAETPAIEVEGREHGHQRREHGYDIAEVLQEHAILRRLLLDEIGEYVARAPQLSHDEREEARRRLMGALDDSGQAAAAQFHAEALAERQRLEAALAAANERKDRFLALLSHELRNPLTVIQNTLHLLSRRISGQPELSQPLSRVERQTQRMDRLINDLLDISRIERGRLEVLRQRLELVALVRETAGDQRGALEAAGLGLNLDLPDALVWVVGDPVRLGQVLDNLVTNAIKFSDPDGQVTVRLEVNSDERIAVVTVQDTGIGIEPEALPHVFELFSQADDGTGRSRDGLGLGLALVKGLVELHGGQVGVRSEGTGHGTLVRFSLPLMQS